MPKLRRSLNKRKLLKLQLPASMILTAMMHHHTSPSRNSNSKHHLQLRLSGNNQMRVIKDRSSHRWLPLYSETATMEWVIASKRNLA